jgi:IMP dehydrogenase
MIFKKTYSFDDVLLIPRKSTILPTETDVSTNLTQNIKINLPIISAPMDTVTEYQMAIALGKQGAAGVIHKNMSIAAQVSQVKKVVKRGVMVGAAISVGDEQFQRALKLAVAGVNFLVVDTAHGHSTGVINMVKRLKNIKSLQKIDIIAGNIVTAEAAYELIQAGADAIKVGIGPGSICTTRVIAGVGIPQISAIIEAVKGRKKSKNSAIPIIADGGIRYSGDIAKAIAAGADCVMLGSLLAGTDESPGKTLKIKGLKYKTYRGMGSLDAMSKGSKDRYGQAKIANNKLVPQGVTGLMPCCGSVDSVVFQLIGGLRSSMGFLGAKTIQDFHRRAKFVEISGAGIKESHPHSLSKINPSINYQ